MINYNKTLGEMPYEWNERHPDRIAILYKNKTYTYKDLHHISLSFATYFATSGVKTGDHVLIMGKNSADWLFAFFGLQMLGAVTVPINPSFTTSEITQIMDIVDATVIVTNEFRDYSEQIKNIYKISKNYKVLYTDQGYQYSHLLSLYPNNQPDDVACILLTSGTTGVPKGVQLSHINLLHNAAVMTDIAGWNDEDNFLLSVPLFHCFGLSATTLCAFEVGAKLCILDSTKSSSLLMSIERDHITVFNGVPALYLVAMHHNDLDDYDLSSLKSGVIAGSPLTAHEYREIKKAYGMTHLIQSYGQTETSPAVTVVRPGESEELSAESVGTTIPNCEIAIVDDDKKPLPAGRPGNIVVRGKNVMKGYINGKNTYTEKDWLCTGDIGRLDNEGHLFISGRTKDIIIRGGENISAIEIENVVKQMDIVDQARALAQKDAVMGEEVCLHLSLTRPVNLEDAEKEIRRYLGEKLVKYKIPKYIVIHDALPTNGTGKIDDKALLQYMKAHLS
ncbi:MAG: class I adenylate-forming enzyme family protein [Peptoniphilus sp.]|nr:class I adenylate-forming enzyme family protein [Peptoniphilus sp.]MDD7363466.1 class I adenylate-forming enzyme family protein [Bacillota bacterium]MDY6044830.1 class I adenylate-forming enzyme family protein [Peptoniphilus sp.]